MLTWCREWRVVRGEGMLLVRSQYWVRETAQRCSYTPCSTTRSCFSLASRAVCSSAAALLAITFPTGLGEACRSSCSLSRRM